MRLTKTEATRRETAILAYFQANPKTSVAKMNAALTSGALTGTPEKMLNIKRGYELRAKALAAPAEAPAQATPEGASAATPVVEGVPAQ